MKNMSEIINYENEGLIQIPDLFEDYLAMIEKQKWYEELSHEEQKNIVKMYETKYEILQDIEWLNTRNELLDTLDLIENAHINYDERVQMLEREINFFSEKLSIIEHDIARWDLNKDFEKKVPLFESDMQSDEYKEFIKYIESKDLRTIKAGEIYNLKILWYDLSKLFLKSNKDVSIETMQVGDSFTVNFWGNNNIESKLGIGDILPIHRFETIRVNWVLGTRKDTPRPWYYDTKWKYLAIYENYKVELISKTEVSEADEEEFKQAFERRYIQVRTPELKNMIVDHAQEQSYSFTRLSQKDFEILKNYLETAYKNDVVVDIKTQTISTTGGKNFDEIFHLSEETELGKAYLKYEDTVERVTNRYANISKEKLIRLINHENAGWDPLISARGSTAYGLGQMIDSTWKKYGKGLNRNNPEHQLDATCRYLLDIMNKKNCSIELAMAYYNTGEGIFNISNKTLNNFYSINAPIVNKIPAWVSRSKKNYFTWAVAYYNDISFEQAKIFVA